MYTNLAHQQAAAIKTSVPHISCLVSCKTID